MVEISAWFPEAIGFIGRGGHGQGCGGSREEAGHLPPSLPTSPSSSDLASPLSPFPLQTQ